VLFLFVLHTVACQKDKCFPEDDEPASSSPMLEVRRESNALESLRVTTHRRFQPGEHCNPAVELLEFPDKPKYWELPEEWRERCRLNHGKQDDGTNRNWCWVAIKNQCKLLDKVKQPWSQVWAMARANGKVPEMFDERFDPLEHPEICDEPSSGQSLAWTPTEWQMSREWLKQHVAVYVINLATDAKRWQYIQAQLEQLGLPAKRIEGVALQESKSLMEAKQSGWIPDSFDMEQAEMHAQSSTLKKISGLRGSAGCASSHFKAQIQSYSDGFPITLVLEDDTLLQEDFVPRLWNMVKTELPCDWDVVSLNSKCPVGRCVSKHLARVQPDFNEREQDCHFGVNFGTHGLLYRTERLPSIRQLMQNATFDVTRPPCMDLDVALASISNRMAYYAVPAVQFPGFMVHENRAFVSTRAKINKKRH